MEVLVAVADVEGVAETGVFDAVVVPVFVVLIVVVAVDAAVGEAEALAVRVGSNGSPVPENCAEGVATCEVPFVEVGAAEPDIVADAHADPVAVTVTVTDTVVQAVPEAVTVALPPEELALAVAVGDTLPVPVKVLLLLPLGMEKVGALLTLLADDVV